MYLRHILYRMTVAAAAVAMGASCDSDSDSPVSSSVTEEDGVAVSAFDMDSATWGMDGVADGDFEMVLVADGTDTAISFAARITSEAGRVRCSFPIARPRELSDGVYRLYLFGADGSRVGRTLEVRMVTERLGAILSAPQLYKPMSGTGTAEDPFIVSGQTDFLSLIVSLDDEKGVHGRGLHYRQTQDVEVPPQSSMTAGRGYYSTPFAGHYDGGSHKLSGLSYTGALNDERDSAIGLFSELLPGAVVENVCIDGLDISRAMTCGAIAGRSSGTVTLRNITATGNISLAGDNVGGLVGCVLDTLIVEGYDLNMTLSGAECIGGVAGRVGTADDQGGRLPMLCVKDMTTLKHRFRITGDGKCGAVAGWLGGKAMVENVTIDHSVQSADQDVSIITATATGCAGALFGRLDVESASAIKNVEILAPVSANEYSGGLVGQCILDEALVLDGCKVSTIISGGKCTGGLLGACEYGSRATSAATTLEFSGHGSRVVVDFNAGEVRGGEQTGGVAGYFRGPSPRVLTTVTVAMNVKATGDYTGGLFGILSGTGSGPVLYLNHFNFSSSSMKVSSQGDYVGAVAGSALHFDIRGDAAFCLHSGDAASAYDVGCLSPDYTGTVEGVACVGGIVGRAEGSRIDGCVISGSVTGSEYVGGVAGEWHAGGSLKPLQSCAMQAKGSVYASGDFCGGIVGYINTAGSDGVCQDCINQAPVRGNDYTGGVVGRAYYDHDLNLSWLVNTGSVRGSGSTGGIVGRAEGDWYNLHVTNSANYGLLTATSGGGDGVGGIIGCSHSQRVHLTGSANHGLIDCGGSGGAAGGVAGCLGHDPGGVSQGENLSVVCCMNSGEVRSSDSSKNLGGILGYQEEGTSSRHEDYCVRDCYNDGPVSSDQNDDTGGLVGKVSHYSYVLRCVNYGKVDYGNACIGTHQESCIFYADYLYYEAGTGKDWSASGSIEAGALSDRSRYSSFDFSDVWHTDRGRAELRKCPWQYIRSYGG